MIQNFKHKLRIVLNDKTEQLESLLDKTADGDLEQKTLIVDLLETYQKLYNLGGLNLEQAAKWRKYLSKEYDDLNKSIVDKAKKAVEERNNKMQDHLLAKALEGTIQKNTKAQADWMQQYIDMLIERAECYKELSEKTTDRFQKANYKILYFEDCVNVEAKKNYLKQFLNRNYIRSM